MRKLYSSLFAIAATAAMAQSLPFNDLVGSSDRKSIMLQAGHIGLAIGGKAHPSRKSHIWSPE